MDVSGVEFFRRRNIYRRLLGLQSFRLGRLLGLGPGRKFVVGAVVVSGSPIALDKSCAEKTGCLSSSTCRGDVHIFASHLRDILNAVGDIGRFLGSLVRGNKHRRHDSPCKCACTNRRFAKAKQLPQGELYKSYGESTFIILLSCLLLIFIATIVWIGMSMPLLTQIVGQAAAVDADFYIKSTTPIALALAALMIYTFIKFGRSISLGGKIAHVGFLAMLAAIVISAQGETITQELQIRQKISIAGHEIMFSKRTNAKNFTSTTWTAKLFGL